MNNKLNLLIPLLLSCTAIAQPTGTFTPTDSMAVGRFWHTATLLNNGKVLIAGGWIDGGATATAELYDPNSGQFTPAGAMTIPRALHTATLLPDGRVLIAGGTTNTRAVYPVNSAEIYDPSTGTFTLASNMVSANACHQATLLGNGKVLITGGTSTGNGVPTAELYDHTTGTFTATGPYASDVFAFNNCQGSVSTLLPDGRVLIVWEEHAAEIYDSGTGLFSSTSKPIAYSYNDGLPTATLLMSGKVLVAGGADDSGEHKSAELYDSATATFAATGSMTGARFSHGATLLPDGNLLMTGGSLFGNTALSSAEIYDPVRGAFAPAGDMTVARCCHTATLLNDGTVLIAGGYNAGHYNSLAEVYRPSILMPAPVLFSLPGGTQGAILHAGTARLVTASNPAGAGEALEIYCTGLAEGSAIPPQVAIGGRLAEILYFGNASGFTGLNQVNVRVPTGVMTGAEVPVRMTYLGRPSNEVTIGVQ